MNEMLYQMQQQNQPLVPPQPQQQGPQQQILMNQIMGPPMQPNPNYPVMNGQTMMMPNTGQMGSFQNGMMSEMPGYGDYVSQFNAMNQPIPNYTQPYGNMPMNSMNPYSDSFSPF